ncbi:inositol monophosphatase family protein [Telmatospirillum sp.]|uniref:inositol monophosphatase family protein n=1 Tax=Telmatospirillum sp. TaxID=2079197 RepID=UPI00283BB92F|nr:inositol monophosphatase family protein [Telmatospirillum sp.]MDR3440170.1 inositol monophosphatase family protein [Telmatospirillum sp.]
MPIIDPNTVTAILRDVAQEVILPRFKRLADTDIREKKPGDLVTIADTEAEAALTRRLSDLLPGCKVVGEEAVATDPSVLENLTGDDPVWILDPVDGTANFVKGRRLFAVIVALVVKGRTVQGWIHDPLSGRTTVAELGAGTWQDAERLRIVHKGALAAMQGAAGYRYGDGLARAVGRLICQGSAAHEYLGLVENRLQFAFFRRLHPWDHAAGVLLHSEAGGYSALLNGSPYRPVPSTEGILLAPDQRSWDQLRPLVARPN